MPPSLAAQRAADAGFNSLRRQVLHALTSIDVCRRQWKTASAAGKQGLQECINARSLFGHAEAVWTTAEEPSWPIRSATLRRGVATRALQQRSDGKAAVEGALAELEAIVGRMRGAVAKMSASLDAAARSAALGERARSEALVHTESATAIIARIEAVVAEYDREVQLKRALAVELVKAASTSGLQDARSADAGYLDDDDPDAAVKIYLSAWVLEVYIEADRNDLLFEGLMEEEPPPNRSPRGRSGGRSGGRGRG